jgi:HEPN domain-containing protein
MRPGTENWITAAEYDLESARYMLLSKRYLYVVFLCHLALEKMLKALVSETTKQPVPKSHDLIFLMKKSGAKPSTEYLEFLGKLNNASIPTRYPEDIQQAIKEYNEDIADEYLKQTERVITWLRSRLKSSR